MIEADLQTTLTAEQVTTLQTELTSIDRAARQLPMRHSDVFLSTMGIIHRLAEVRPQPAPAA